MHVNFDAISVRLHGTVQTIFQMCNKNDRTTYEIKLDDNVLACETDIVTQERPKNMEIQWRGHNDLLDV